MTILKDSSKIIPTNDKAIFYIEYYKRKQQRNSV